MYCICILNLDYTLFYRQCIHKGFVYLWAPYRVAGAPITNRAAKGYK